MLYSVRSTLHQAQVPPETEFVWRGLHQPSRTHAEKLRAPNLYFPEAALTRPRCRPRTKVGSESRNLGETRHDSRNSQQVPASIPSALSVLLRQHSGTSFFCGFFEILEDVLRTSSAAKNRCRAPCYSHRGHPHLPLSWGPRIISDGCRVRM